MINQKFQKIFIYLIQTIEINCCVSHSITAAYILYVLNIWFLMVYGFIRPNQMYLKE